MAKNIMILENGEDDVIFLDIGGHTSDEVTGWLVGLAKAFVDDPAVVTSHIVGAGTIDFLTDLIQPIPVFEFCGAAYLEQDAVAHYRRLRVLPASILKQGLAAIEAGAPEVDAPPGVVADVVSRLKEAIYEKEFGKPLNLDRDLGIRAVPNPTTERLHAPPQHEEGSVPGEDLQGV
jgi:hypothetical protein